MKIIKSKIGDEIEHISNGVNCKQNKNGIGEKISRIETISKSCFDFSKVGYSKLSNEQKKKYKINYGEILFSHINSKEHIGKTAIYKNDNNIYHGINLLRIKTSEKIDPFYFNYFLKHLFLSSFWKKIAKQSNNQASVNIKDIKNIKFNYPIKNEQKRTVAKLDKAFEEINKLERVQKNKISLFNQIKKSILSSIIIDELKKKEVKLIKLKEVVSYEKKNGQGSGLPYVGMEDISSDSMMLVNEVKVPLNTSNTFLFNSNHILYGRLRPYLKKILIPNFSGQCSTELFCIKPEKFLDRKFLAYWLLTPEISDKINKTSTGTRMPRANMKDLLEFEIHLPELAQQKKIVKKIEGIVNEIELLISNSEILLENYKALKSSLLRQELQQENVA